MKQIYVTDEWKVIEQGFSNETNKISESVMSLGNGHLGFRGNFEEGFSGSTLKGIYIAGVYYPDKTRVGWWKNGYPKYFAKVLNSCDFLSLTLEIDGERIDINRTLTEEMVRTLDLRCGTLTREFDVITKRGKRVHITSKRFVSMRNKEVGVIRYEVTPVNCGADISLTSYLDGNVRNEDANYNEFFWTGMSVFNNDELSCITMSTKTTDYVVSTSKADTVMLDERMITGSQITSEEQLFAGHRYKEKVSEGSRLCLYKYFAVTTSRDYERDDVARTSKERVLAAKARGFVTLLHAHEEAWREIWDHSDVEIKGDEQSQQGIRFNIFHLNQTYTGHDNRLNIGPKGFTGEKYGGSTYWDTEAFCLPFYLATAKEQVSRNLLIYRYNHLEKAKENASKLGLSGALYPMVTMNGEESHNEWEITFEEIHRNGAIAHAIYNYVRYTGDECYLGEYGVYVLVEIARFWASRVTYQPKKKKYMILGVTGPNEYENNVNNNYYTNMMAAFCLSYANEVVDRLKQKDEKQYEAARKRLRFTPDELEMFVNIAENMYYPMIEEFGVFAQQDGYMDKQQLTVGDLKESDRPLCQNWSWDRILRSCFIKQADVLQGMFNFPDNYDTETKRRNFDFYEPRTVHESSLSSCIYSIIASEAGYYDKAYELYLRASRLDLDNYNNDTADGLHITSTTGSWLAIVHGFAGMHVRSGHLAFSPYLPNAWESYSFKIYFRGATVRITVKSGEVVVAHEGGGKISLEVYNKTYTLDPAQTLTAKKMA